MARQVWRFKCVTDSGAKYEFDEWVWSEADATALANSYEEVMGDRVVSYSALEDADDSES